MPRQKHDEPATGGISFQNWLLFGAIILMIATLAFAWNTNTKVSNLLDGNVVADTQGAVADPQTQPSNDDQGQAAAPTVQVSADDDAVRGDEDAPIEIIEFSDFQCPYCGRFYEETLPQIEQQYIETGKVKLVFRDFPLSFHPYAEKAAEAAECAGDQDMYWEMHDMIFSNQDAITVDDLKGYAADLGLDTEEFDTCLDSGEKAAEIQADFNAGRAAGVSGTPTFFINGVQLVGAQPFAAFQQVIDQQLAQQ